MRVARWLIGTILLVALAGCSGSTAGQGLYLGSGAPPSSSESTSGEPPTSTAPTTTSEGTTSASTTSSPAPPPSTTAAPPPPPSSSAPPSGPGGLIDDGWLVESFEYSGGASGLFEATARITNTEDTERSAIYTFTLFDGESIVATFLGSSNEVPPGDTVTATLISGDTFVEGEFSVDFQVDFSF